MNLTSLYWITLSLISLGSASRDSRCDVGRLQFIDRVRATLVSKPREVRALECLRDSLKVNTELLELPKWNICEALLIDYLRYLDLGCLSKEVGSQEVRERLNVVTKLLFKPVTDTRSALALVHDPSTPLLDMTPVRTSVTDTYISDLYRISLAVAGIKVHYLDSIPLPSNPNYTLYLSGVRQNLRFKSGFTKFTDPEDILKLKSQNAAFWLLAGIRAGENIGIVKNEIIKRITVLVSADRAAFPPRECFMPSVAINMSPELVEDVIDNFLNLAEEMQIRLLTVAELTKHEEVQQAASDTRDAIKDYIEGFAATSWSTPLPELVAKISRVSRWLLHRIGSYVQIIDGAKIEKLSDNRRPITFVNTVGTCWLSTVIPLLLAIPNIETYIDSSPNKPFMKAFKSVIMKRDSGQATAYVVKLRNTFKPELNYCAGAWPTNVLDDLLSEIPQLRLNVIRLDISDRKLYVGSFQDAAQAEIAKRKLPDSRLPAAIIVKWLDNTLVETPMQLKVDDTKYQLVVIVEGGIMAGGLHVWAKVWVEEASSWYEIDNHSAERLPITVNARAGVSGVSRELLLYRKLQH